MISVSTAFMQKINNGEIPSIRMQMVTADSRTIWFENSQLWSESVSFSEATTQDGTFSVGSAVIGSFSFTLNNFNRYLDNVDFAGAVVIPIISFDGLTENVSKGVYYISKHTTNGNVIRCVALDGMKLFDEHRTTITYPTTVQSLVESLCTANNITLATTTIPHGDFVLAEPLNASGEPLVLTDRQKLSYACQCIGCYAKMNNMGELEIKWYDFANPIGVTTTFSGKSLWTLPIEVTGISVLVGDSNGALMAMSIDSNGMLNYIRSDEITDTFPINASGEMIATVESDATYAIDSNGYLIRTGEELTTPDVSNGVTNVVLYGTDERVINVSDNPYITIGNVVSVCENISSGIFGITFRPGTLPILANPCLEAGDVLRVTDTASGLVYLIPITSTTYNKGLIQNVTCAFESKEDEDLRPNSNYNVRVSVQNALDQAKAADEAAQAAMDAAQQSGYSLTILSSQGMAFSFDTSADLRAIIYDNEMNEIDPDGEEYLYRWWVAQDASSNRYLDGGKEIVIHIADPLCDYAAGIYYELLEVERGNYPFALCNRSSAILTTRDGKMLTARAAERVGT